MEILKPWIIALISVGICGCGPAPRADWTIAAKRRTAEDDLYSSRIWIIGADGYEHPISSAPDQRVGLSMRRFQRVLSWDHEGNGLYLEDYELWFYADGHFDPLYCPNSHCPAPIDDLVVLPEGQLVATFETMDSPTEHGHGPKGYLATIDQRAQTYTLLDDAHAYGCVGAGSNGVVMARAMFFHSSTDPLDGEEPSVETTSRDLVWHDGNLQILEDRGQGSCPRLAPSGESIAWPQGPSTSITTLDDTPLHTIPYGGDSQWARDGRRLAGIGDGQLWIFDLEDETVASIDHPEVDDITWSADGERLALTRRCTAPYPSQAWREIWIYDADGLVERHHQACTHGAWAGLSSDGRHYALSILEDGQRYFRVVDTDDGRSTDLLDGEPMGFRPEG